MLRIVYSKYKFTNPDLFSLKEYENIKEMMQKKPDYKIQPKINFLRAFKLEISIFILIFFSALIGLSLVFLYPNLIIFFIVFVIILISIGVILRFLFSLEYYFEYINDHKLFYDKLKDDVINSTNYEDFLIIRKIAK